MCKIVNIFGEPGVGKSALAAYIFYRLKVMGYNCELCTEFAKDMVYEKNDSALSNQSYIFGQQMQKMNRLKNNVDIIITDSPLFLCGLYVKEGKIANSFFNLIYDLFNSFDNYNYLLKRTHNYVHDGRLQDEEGAKEIRDELIASLRHYKVPYEEVICTVDPSQFNNPAGDYIVSQIIKDLKAYDELERPSKKSSFIGDFISKIKNKLNYL